MILAWKLVRFMDVLNEVTKKNQFIEVTQKRNLPRTTWFTNMLIRYIQPQYVYIALCCKHLFKHLCKDHFPESLSFKQHDDDGREVLICKHGSFCKERPRINKGSVS